MRDDVRALGDIYARTMPDEFPEGYAYWLAEQHILEEEADHAE